MGAVAAEEVKDFGVGRYEAADQVGDGGYCAVVDVDQQAGLAVEERVAGFVLAAEMVPGEKLLPAEIPIGGQRQIGDFQNSLLTGLVYGFRSRSEWTMEMRL